MCFNGIIHLLNKLLLISIDSNYCHIYVAVSSIQSAQLLSLKKSSLIGPKVLVYRTRAQSSGFPRPANRMSGGVAAEAMCASRLAFMPSFIAVVAVASGRTPDTKASGLFFAS